MERWILFVYRVPADPSRHRVSVWRAIRKLGAISLQHSVCALPDTKENRRHLLRLGGTIEAIGGEAFLLRGEPIDRTTRDRLEKTYSEAIEKELEEFMTECRKFKDEIVREIEIQKLTQAELAEEEESYERLERWFAALSAKDIFGASAAPDAERALKESSAALDGFAQKVWEQEGARS